MSTHPFIIVLCLWFSHHCVISVVDDNVMLEPSKGALCSLDGDEVVKETKLWQGKNESRV